MSLAKLDLLGAIKNEVTRSRHPGARRLPTFYPSSASVDVGNGNIEGGCWRADWYRLNQIPESNPSEFYISMIHKLGKAVEDVVVDAMKCAGVYEANAVKFYDPKYNISGELDVVGRYRIKTTGEIKYYIVECATPGSLVVGPDYRLTRFDEFAETGRLKNHAEVISHKSIVRKVENFQIREVKDELLYRFTGKFDGLYSEVTGNHPLQVADITVGRKGWGDGRQKLTVNSLSWKKAKELQIGDYLCIPKAKFTGSRTLKYSDIVPDWGYEVLGGMIIPKGKGKNRAHLFPELLELDEDFLWLLGLYIAEGSTTDSRTYFSLHEDETDYVEKIARIVSKFGLSVHVEKLISSRTKLPSKGINVSVQGKAFTRLIKALVPGNTLMRTKHVRYDCIPHELISSLMDGIWAGDGTTDWPSLRKVSTAVPHLAYLYFQIAAHLGLNPSLKQFKQASQFNSEFIYVVSWSVATRKNNSIKLVDCGDSWAYSIRGVKLRPYSGPVYNMEVAEDNSYTLGLLATHNCKSVYSHGAVETITGRSRAYKGRPAFRPKPKTGNVLQVMTYLDQFSEDRATQFRLEGAKLVYLPRDKPTDGREYTIVLVKKGFDRGEMPKGDYDTFNGLMAEGKQYAHISTPGYPDYVETRFSVEDMYARWTEQLRMFQAKETPPRTYKKVYSKEEIEAKYADGEISDSAYEMWQKGRATPGHFLCTSYCSWRGWCYCEDGSPNPEADLVTIRG